MGFKLFFAFVQGHIIQCKLQSRERHEGKSWYVRASKKRLEGKEKNRQNAGLPTPRLVYDSNAKSEIGCLQSAEQ